MQRTKARALPWMTVGAARLVRQSSLLAMLQILAQSTPQLIMIVPNTTTPIRLLRQRLVAAFRCSGRQHFYFTVWLPVFGLDWSFAFRQCLHMIHNIRAAIECVSFRKRCTRNTALTVPASSAAQVKDGQK